MNYNLVSIASFIHMKEIICTLLIFYYIYNCIGHDFIHAHGVMFVANIVHKYYWHFLFGFTHLVTSLMEWNWVKHCPASYTKLRNCTLLNTINRLIKTHTALYYIMTGAHCIYAISVHEYIDGIAQDCSNSIANALELLQSCAKPSISGRDEMRSMILCLLGIHQH